MKNKELNEEHIKEIERRIRVTSLFGPETTDVLTEVARLSAKWMMEMMQDDFIKLLDSTNHAAFQNNEEYVKFLKENI